MEKPLSAEEGMRPSLGRRPQKGIRISPGVKKMRGGTRTVKIEGNGFRYLLQGKAKHARNPGSLLLEGEEGRKPRMHMR